MMTGNSRGLQNRETQSRTGLAVPETHNNTGRYGGKRDSTSNMMNIESSMIPVDGLNPDSLIDGGRL